ncbi:unnamed protein product, partial [marine sediment metagenome]
VFDINGTHGTAVLVEDKITSWTVSDSKETIAKESITGVKGKAGTADSPGRQVLNNHPVTHLLKIRS